MNSNRNKWERLTGHFILGLNESIITKPIVNGKILMKDRVLNTFNEERDQGVILRDHPGLLETIRRTCSQGSSVLVMFFSETSILTTRIYRRSVKKKRETFYDMLLFQCKR